MSIKSMDQILIVYLMALSDEIQQDLIKIDKTDQLYGLEEIMSFLVVEHSSHFHDVNKVELMNLIYYQLRYKGKGSAELKEWLFDLCQTVPFVSGIYSSEIKNFNLQRSLKETVKHCNKYIVKEENMTDLQMIKNWKAFQFLYMIKSLLEYKKDLKQLTFESFISILEEDLRTCTEGYPLSLLNREFGKHIVAEMNQREMNYRQLRVIQKAVQKYSASFPEPNKTFNECVTSAYNKIIKEF